MTPHPIFQEVSAGRYAQGLALYAELKVPTPQDERWAGYCLFALGRLLDAKDMLLRAKARGCVEAGLEFTTVLRSLGDMDAAMTEITLLPLDRLAPLEQGYALREKAALLLHNGDLIAAREALERAWSVLGGTHPTSSLVAQTAQLLGYTYHRLGRDAPARHYLNVALQNASGAKGLQPLLTRAQVNLYAGRYDEALQDLTAAEALMSSAPGARAYHAYLQGLLHRSSGRWDAALTAFVSAGGAARLVGETGTEFLAALGMVTVLSFKGQTREARPHLLRASRLCSNAWERAMVDLRQGYWQLLAGDGQACATLERAKQAFEKLHLPREMAWADLHLAEALTAQDADAALVAFRRAAEQSEVLESVAPLLPELRLLPQLTALLAARSAEPDVSTFLLERRQVCADQPLEVHLVTLGTPKLMADGQEIKLRLRRTIELLAYLLLKGSVRRDDILATLWPDDDPQTAKNYFHQANFALKEAAPYLRIAYDRRQERYTLLCEGPTFTWDADLIKRLLSAPDDNDRQRAVSLYTAAFLPDIEADWVREERDTLAFSVMNVGLKLMTQWSAAGEYQKCATLSRRLLRVEPCDETLAEFLVEATLQLEGEVAAQRALKEVALRATQELGWAPDWVDRLNQKVYSLN